MVVIVFVDAVIVVVVVVVVVDDVVATADVYNINGTYQKQLIIKSDVSKKEVFEYTLPVKRVSG